MPLPAALPAALSSHRTRRWVVINWLTSGALAQFDRMENLMAVTQADLDNLATQLVEDHGEIQQELARLASDHPELDLSGLRTAVTNIGQLVPSHTGGGEGPVAEDPSAPIVAGPDDAVDVAADNGTDPVVEGNTEA